MVNSSGMLVTQTGLPVLSDGGAPVLINAETNWRVSPDGAIEQDGAAAFATVPVVVMIGYLLVARRLGAFDNL
jgi:flagellar basal body rod protein FlgG